MRLPRFLASFRSNAFLVGFMLGPILTYAELVGKVVGGIGLGWEMSHDACNLVPRHFLLEVEL